MLARMFGGPENALLPIGAHTQWIIMEEAFIVPWANFCKKPMDNHFHRGGTNPFFGDF